MINGFSFNFEKCKTERWILDIALIKFFFRGFSINFLLEFLVILYDGRF